MFSSIIHRKIAPAPHPPHQPLAPYNNPWPRPENAKYAERWPCVCGPPRHISHLPLPLQQPELYGGTWLEEGGREGAQFCFALRQRGGGGGGGGEDEGRRWAVRRWRTKGQLPNITAVPQHPTRAGKGTELRRGPIDCTSRPRPCVWGLRVTGCNLT